jgi:hypothetical protein
MSHRNNIPIVDWLEKAGPGANTKVPTSQDHHWAARAVSAHEHRYISQDLQILSISRALWNREYLAKICCLQKASV